MRNPGKSIHKTFTLQKDYLRLTTHYELCVMRAGIFSPVSSHWDQPVSK